MNYNFIYSEYTASLSPNLIMLKVTGDPSMHKHSHTTSYSLVFSRKQCVHFDIIIIHDYYVN